MQYVLQKNLASAVRLGSGVDTIAVFHPDTVIAAMLRL